MKSLSLRSRGFYGCMTILLVILLDQLSKYWVLYGLHLPQRGSIYVLPFLNFTMVWNHAVTFGLFQNHWKYAPIVFSVIALMVCAGLLLWMFRSRSLLTSCCLGAIIGGALGNVCDRLHYGSVVDFLHAHLFHHSWYVFNIADSAIVCAVCILMVVGVGSHE